MSVKTGQCMCGAVQLTARNVPTTFGQCLCDMCKRWTGSFFMGVSVAPEDLEITGADAITTIQSSDWAERAFCNKCGSSLWYHVTEGPYAAKLSLGVGVLNETDDMVPVREFYSDKRTCAYQPNNDIEKFTEAQVRAMFAAPDAPTDTKG